jgi:Spy/CpxP family protein refolding chaperone
MRKAGAWATVVAVFLVGVVVGAFGLHVLYGHDLVDPPFRKGPPGGRPPGGGPPGGGFGSGRHIQMLEERLDLTPEQAAQIHEILRESHAEGERLRREFEPQLRRHMDETRRRIDEVLTPEQREEFDGMNRRHRRRVERWLLGH